MQINLLEETESVLKEHNLLFRYIKFIANAEGFIEVASFIESASQCWYDNDGGEVEIDPTLVIVGFSWWLTRFYENGHERWVFHKKPEKPALPAVGFKLKAKRSASQINSKQ